MSELVNGGYRWDLQDLPGWFIAELYKAGLPLRFTPETLTPPQRDALLVLSTLLSLYQRGLIGVDVDPVTGATRYYRVEEA